MDPNLFEPPTVKTKKFKSNTVPTSLPIVPQRKEDTFTSFIPIIACSATLAVVYFIYKEVQKMKSEQYKLDQNVKHILSKLDLLNTINQEVVVEPEEEKDDSMISLPDNLDNISEESYESENDDEEDVVELVSS
tara:strand:- start:284 stop:685 length:402 start_codon:yes stop_codon:yes gene_type:complete